MRLATAPLYAVLVVSACVSPVKVTKPGGDGAVVRFRQGGSTRVELLAVSDSNLLFVRDNAVTRAALVDISFVRVDGFGARTERRRALACFGVVNTPFCAVAACHSAWPFVAATAALTVVGAKLLGREKLRFDFRSPFDTGARGQLALHCRYPQGLNDAQWRQLLGFYGQDDFVTPVRLSGP